MSDGLGTAQFSSRAGGADAIALPDGVFKARPLLKPAEARRAYALVVLAHPRVTARQWDDFVRRQARGARERGGLVAIEDQRRYVHAVFRYAVDPSPLISDGRTLRLHDVVMAQLPGHALVAALVACADRLATGLGCSAVALDVPAASAAEASAGLHATVALQLAGFWMAAAMMVRTVAL